MKHIKWSIYEGGKHIASGTMTAESDKEALTQIMGEQDGKLAPDKSYAFTAGELTTSSYGDELARSAHVASHGMDENAPMDAPHHFQPNLSDAGIDGDLLRKAAKDFMSVEGSKAILDTLRRHKNQVVDDGWAQSARDLHEKTKLERYRKAGRRTFTPIEAAEIVKRMVGRDVYCGNNPVWTQKEVDTLIGKLRCPVSSPGPNGGHDWEDIPNSVGTAGCKGLGHESCRKCSNARVKRRWPKQADGVNAPKRMNGRPITKSRQRSKPNSIVGHAISSGKKGDIIDIVINAQGHSCRVRCAKDVVIGEALRANGDGDVYGYSMGPVSQGIPAPTRAPSGRMIFNPPPPDQNQLNAQNALDGTVREVIRQRENFALRHGVSFDDVEVSFIQDQVEFSLKD